MNRRQRPEDTDPVEARYASCFIAMQMGRRLLRDLRLTKVEQINHLNFNDGNQLIEANGGKYYSESLSDIKFALSCLYKEDVSLQQLSATFRRGDLIGRLSKIQLADNET